MLQDLILGAADVGESVKMGRWCRLGMGHPLLQEETAKSTEAKYRTGEISSSTNDSSRMVTFGPTSQEDGMRPRRRLNRGKFGTWRSMVTL